MSGVEFPKWVYSARSAPQLVASVAAQAALPPDYTVGPPSVAVVITPASPVSRVEPLVILTAGNLGILSHDPVRLKDKPIYER